LIVALLAACGGGSSNPGKDGGPGDDAIPIQPDAATAYGPTFRFAVVGDTRPANEDDVNGYPTAVITRIWADVEAANPHPDFAISTGDYIFASPTLMPSTVDKQLDVYLRARGQYTNAVFAAMGNHECTGATASNCGAGSTSGITLNLAEYQKRMLAPLGITQPYFAFSFHANDNSWTAKMVFVAANAWNPTQSAWLDQTLAVPTTYTFVVRHESPQTTETPGVTPSQAIINKYPLTLLVVGHTHTWGHFASDHELMVGNGGAPLTSGTGYGYTVVERLASGVIQATAYDYQANTQVSQFRVNANGSAAP
jgi:hypothetical protein